MTYANFKATHDEIYNQANELKQAIYGKVLSLSLFDFLRLLFLQSVSKFLMNWDMFYCLSYLLMMSLDAPVIFFLLSLPLFS